MANVKVPQGMVPGRAGYPFAFSGPGLCDIGPNSRDGLWPEAWVEVAILPRDPVTVMPDAAGRLLHCLWEFARPTVGRGKRRQVYPAWQPNGIPDVEPIRVETDPGTFWVGTDSKLSFVGGTVGDEYLVSVTYSVPRDEVDPDDAIDVYEDPFRFTLTSIFVSGAFIDFPAPPDYHTGFQIVSGRAQINSALGVVPLGATPFATPIPLNLGPFQVETGTYQTSGAI